MKKNGHTSRRTKVPAFAARAERAMRRAAKNVRAQNRAMKLPLIVWQDGKVWRNPLKHPGQWANTPPNKGTTEEEALKRGMEVKSKEFAGKSAEA